MNDGGAYHSLLTGTNGQWDQVHRICGKDDLDVGKLVLRLNFGVQAMCSLRKSGVCFLFRSIYAGCHGKSPGASAFTCGAPSAWRKPSLTQACTASTASAAIWE